MNETLEDRRCRRGKLCAGREKVVTGRTTGWENCDCGCHGRTDTACDEDGGCGHLHTEPADTHVWAGKLLETAQGMCWSCTGRLGLALDELAGGELLARLALEHEPSLEIQYRTVDITSSDPLYPALVINEHAEALSSLLAYELDGWAWFVADDAGLTDSGEWDARLAAMSREGSRIVAAALLLRHRLDQWLALPVQDYPARSLGIHPQDGLNPEHVYQDEGEWRVRRDGLDAANVILDLHFKISRFTGGAPSDHVPVPCGYCSNRTLRRDHESGVVRCRTCGDTKTDDGYDAFVLAALNVHAQPAA